MHAVGCGVDGVKERTEDAGDDGDNASYCSHPLIMAAIYSNGTGQEVPIEVRTGSPACRDSSGCTIVP